MTALFLRYQQGRNVYHFECGHCGSIGEVHVPADSQRIFDHGCDSDIIYIQRSPRSLFEKPRLEEIVITKEGKA